LFNEQAALRARRLFGCREEQGASSEGVEVGDLSGWKRQSDQAIIDLFRHYDGGQAGGKRCPQGAVEQTLQVIARPGEANSIDQRLAL
jgi:hypothetical protein